MDLNFTILVVDDEPQILSGTSRLLKQKGYTIFEAENGQQALDAAKKHIPDLMLLDNMLPDISGIEVCRRLKAEKATAGIFISIVSGFKKNASDKSDGLETGADEYITRPITNRELLARVNAMLRLRNAEKQLERHRDRLDEIVAKRTDELEREIAERKQVETTMRQRSKELAALNRVSTQVSQTLSVQQVVTRALEGVLAATEASAAFLLMKKGDDLIPEGVAFSEPGRAFAEFPTHKLGECLCGMAVTERQSIFSTDIYKDLRCTWEECKQAGLRSAAALPLFSGQDIIAVLGLGTESAHDFAAHTQYLETLASAVALGLQNAILFEQTEQHARELHEKVRMRTRELEDSRNALIKLLEDVNQAKEQLEQANVKLKELDRLKSMFIASMSHELRTPLNSIIGFTSIILQGLTGEINTEQRDQLERVYSSAGHLLSLINDVIDVSKIEAGRVDVYPEPCWLSEIIAKAVSSLEPAIGKKRLKLEVISPDGIRLVTDRRRLFQCVINYLSNAVKYSREGTIRIEAGEAGDQVRIQVRDTGIGIASEDLPRLFASFVRLDSELKTKELGTGLGLYLTRKIATELLGGSVSVESTLGVGSVFSLFIPKKFVSSGEVA